MNLKILTQTFSKMRHHMCGTIFQSYLVKNQWKFLYRSYFICNKPISQDCNGLSKVKLNYFPINQVISKPYVDEIKWNKIYYHQFSTENGLSSVTYEQVSEATLESLYECLEELLEVDGSLDDSDIILSSGVLTLKLGHHGTYVINKQSPNQQIWLSSPSSGPKRFDFIDNNWIYKHDDCSLHHLLNEELSNIFKNTPVDLSSCEFSGSKHHN